MVEWAVSTPLVDGVVFGPPEAGASSPVCAVAVVAGIRGFGKGVTQTAAFCSAVGEALELYAARNVPRTSLIRAPYRELAAHAFDPRWAGLYSSEQYARPAFSYRPFDPGRPMLWTSGFWLDTGEPVWMPAAGVYLSTALEAEEALWQGTSNGLAAGSSLAEAAGHAVLELYERSEFIRAWLARQAGQDYPLSNLAPEFAGAADYARSRDATVSARLLSTEPYVGVCIARGDGCNWPGATLGLGAAWSAREAVAKAVLEHGQTGPFLARIWCNRELPIPETPDAIRTFQDHALYYCDPARANELNFFLEADRSPPPAQPGVRFAIADLTTSDLQDSPFRVVRALARGLQPIHYGYGLERTLMPSIQAILNGKAPNPGPIPIC